MSHFNICSKPFQVISLYYITFRVIFMARKVRTEHVDRISNLPDEILRYILSFLSTKESVATSILSTRWRSLFTLVLNILDIESDYKQKRPKTSTSKSLENYIDRVLFAQNASNIEKFCLKGVEGIDSSRVCRWMSATLRRGVQHLDVESSNVYFRSTLPAVDLFTTRTLVTLKLNIKSSFTTFPDNVCLPNLKSLYLKSVSFLNEYGSFERLYSSCISLEDMVLKNCNFKKGNINISHNSLKRLTLYLSGFSYWTHIDASMLVYLKYKDSGAFRYSLGNLQSLVRAEIDFGIALGTQAADATPFYEGICNVQSLNLSSTSLKLLLSCVQAPVFPNLVQLKIFYDFHQPWCVFDYFSQEKGVAAKLMNTLPDLETLAFCQKVFNYLPEEVPSCLSCKLKAIEISEFEAGEDCIEKAKYFLENAGVLEKLIIRTKNLAEKEKRKITEQLLATPMKSNKCCILIL